MSDFPSATDLQRVLDRVGLSSTTTAERTRWLKAAVEKLEQLTRCKPWMATSFILTRHYDTPVRWLSQFPAYLLTAGGVSVRVNGVELPADAYRYEADDLGRTNAIQLLSPAKGIIEIGGKWGYAPAGDFAVPEDVWHAVLLEAATYALREYKPPVSDQRIESLKQGDLHIKYVQGHYVSPLEEVAARYRRRWL